MRNLGLPKAMAARMSLHNEVHARPASSICLPALIIYVAVINEGVSREQECDHLRKLPGQEALTTELLQDNFFRVTNAQFSVKWERHSEFSRYSIVHPLPPTLTSAEMKPHAELCLGLKVPASWMEEIPGETLSAVLLVMVEGNIEDVNGCIASAQRWLGRSPTVVSIIGSSGHSLYASDLQVQEDGFERMIVISGKGTPSDRPGRVAQRFLEIETYRLLALRGLAVAKEITPSLTSLECTLADITTKLERKAETDQALLDLLISQASSLERLIATHSYRFSASRAYDGLVRQRIVEIKEKTVPGYQPLGEFLKRRIAPAISTVVSTSSRLNALSERVSRTSALLRTRVDIASEAQNQQLLEKLTKGQELQLRLQATVEGLSVAAISYYVVSLVGHGAQALHAAGLPLNAEMVSGVSIPIVLLAVWRLSAGMQNKLFKHHQ